MTYHFHLIAPSGVLLDEVKLTQAIAWLRSLGHEVSEAANLRVRDQRFAGSDEARLQALYEAAEHPTATHLLAIRGGYGLSRLVHRIDFTRLAAANKTWIGHSDFNLLQLAMLAKTRKKSLCGPLACFDFGETTPNDWMAEKFWQTLRGEAISVAVMPFLNVDANSNANEGVIEGCLWGGNLAIVHALLATPYLPQLADGILFLEDVYEHPYKIERMLWSLFHCGLLQQQKAIVFGQFSDYKLVPSDAGYDLQHALGRIVSELNVPVFTGLPFGHVHHKLTLPQGGKAAILRHATQQGQQQCYLNFQWDQC